MKNLIFGPKWGSLFGHFGSSDIAGRLFTDHHTLCMEPAGQRATAELRYNERWGARSGDIMKKPLFWAQNGARRLHTQGHWISLAGSQTIKHYVRSLQTKGQPLSCDTVSTGGETWRYLEKHLILGRNGRGSSFGHLGSSDCAESLTDHHTLVKEFISQSTTG